MKITRTIQVNDGSWYALADFTRDICCDCGLVHDMDWKIENGRIMVRTVVNRRETTKQRKASGIAITRLKP